MRGIVEGICLGNGYEAFLGIPYAAPPVKDLRWRQPQPVKSWDAIRAANQYGASCVQFPPPNNSIYYGGETSFSEDCLFLNVWTASSNEGNPTRSDGEMEMDSQAKRPVLVVLHFGAYQFGSSSNSVYNGESMARKGLTVVSLNYRLGRLGFLAHPWLTAKSGTNSSGNYGLMDQIAALQWIQRNIVAFGGDPDNVTLMGVSAGAHSIHNLRVSPLAKGLFHKCIVASGPGFAHALDGLGHPANPSTLAAGEKAGVEVATLLNATSMDELRKMPADRIMAVQLPRAAGNWTFDLLPAGASISLSVFDSGYPVVDGYVMPQAPLDAFLEMGNPNVIDVPILASNTGNEASGLPYLARLSAYQAYVTGAFGTLANEVLHLYPASNDAEARTSSWRLLADQVFVWSTLTAARLQSRNLKSKAWYARFLREPLISPDADLIEREYAGAFHTADVMYALCNLQARPWNWTRGDEELSRAMMDAWLSFAKTGDPNDGGKGNWPPVKSADGLVKIWDLESQVGKMDGDLQERMAFWDRWNGVANVGY
ncbi:hypothetical protein N0V83_008963 [Neocucurbitaria cava]|uniref:Carboxylic ester hydrolase n=1 Tax=Neocucurbitaria cava TaxID=798079 RepID=A0A9W9CJ95_9PLEO|nr:hypothetical protein N0V83_008963 [Neocucurbitaria cava]